MVTNIKSSIIRRLLVGFRRSRGHFPFGGGRPPKPLPLRPIASTTAARKHTSISQTTMSVNSTSPRICGPSCHIFSTVLAPRVAGEATTRFIRWLCASLQYAAFFPFVLTMLYPSALPIVADRYIALPAVTTTTQAKNPFVHISSLPVFGAVQKGGTETLCQNALPNAHSQCRACPPPTALPLQPHNPTVSLVTQSYKLPNHLLPIRRIAIILLLIASTVMSAPNNNDNTHGGNPPPATTASQTGMPPGMHANGNGQAGTGGKMVSYNGMDIPVEVLQRLLAGAGLNHAPPLKSRQRKQATLLGSRGFSLQ